MALATLSIDIVAQLARLQQGMDRAGQIAARTAQQIEARNQRMLAAAREVGVAIGGAFSVAAIIAFTRSTIDAIDALNDAADATGSTVEKLSALERAAVINGKTLGDVTDVIIKLNKALQDAKPGNEQAQALKAIGLSAKELEGLDPSDVLLKVAFAFGQFADNGEKARAMQVLLGKSLKEGGPLLKDLLVTTRQTATTTTEAAQAAENLNRELGRFNANANEAGRALLSALIPAFNAVVKDINAAREAYGGLIGAFLNTGPFQRFSRDAKGLNEAAAEFDRLTAEIAKRRGSTDLRDAFAIPGLERQREALGRTLTYLREIVTLGSPRSLVEGVGRTVLPSVGKIEEAGKVARESKRHFEDYQQAIAESIGKLAEESKIVKLQRLQDQFAALRDLAAAGLDPRIVRDIDDALTDLQRKLVQVEETGFRAFRRSELGGTVGVNAAFSTEQIEEASRARQRLNAILAETPIGQLRAAGAEMAFLREQFEAGRVAPEEYAQAIDVLQQRLEALGPTAKQVGDELSEFAKEAQRVAERILNVALRRALEGDFKSIGDLWRRLLADMAAQAAAARLNEWLFGKGGSGGVLTDAFKWLFGSVGAGLATARGAAFSGGQVQPYALGGVVGSPTLFGFGGRLGLMGEAGPEAVLPLKRTSSGRLGVESQGGGSVIYNVYTGVSRNEMVTALQMLHRTMRGELNMKLRNAGVA